MILYFIFLIFSIFFAVIILRRKKNNVIIVLGDINRSPRMLYHTTCMFKSLKNLYLVCFNDKIDECSILHIMKSQNPPLGLISIQISNNLPTFLPRSFLVPLKLILQTIEVIFVFLRLIPVNILLIQNPPSISSLIPCILLKPFGLITKIVLDWHNYGYTLLPMSSSSSLIKIYQELYRCLEFNLARLADQHLCVSQAMEKDLTKKLNINQFAIKTFYDKPASYFTMYSGIDYSNHRLELFGLNVELKSFIDYLSEDYALVVSSTSWTDDEDFSILLESFISYEAASVCKNLRKILCIITGKPCENSFTFMQKYESFCLKNVKIFSKWFSFESYISILKYADLGVSLHKSSSGLDLPMKVVDMLGSGLPVCAYKYDTISELVKNGINGVLFKNSSQLCNIFQELLSTEDSLLKLKKMRKNIQNISEVNFEQEWTQVVDPFIKI